MKELEHYPRSTMLVLFAFLVFSAFSSARTDAGDDKAKAPADQRDAALFGVVTEFAVQPIKIKHADKLQITLKMTNVTREPVKFRYISCIESHVKLFNAEGKGVSLKQGAPILECPYLEVEIQAGATAERTAQFGFGTYYSVPDGTYTISFDYDLRLMKAPALGKDPWVSWGKSRHKIIVKE